MQIRLELEDDRDRGFVVRWREEGTLIMTELYTSLSRKMALDRYHIIRNRIRSDCFTRIDSKESAVHTYTLFESNLMMVPTSVISKGDDDVAM